LAYLQQHAAAQSDKMTKFAIASQPLAKALDTYSRLSGLEVAYDGALAAGRWSHPVDGMLASDEALRELLIGTGLSAKATGQNSFMVAPMSQSVAPNSSQQSYIAAVQHNVARVLCAFPETRPRAADVIIQFWVDASGVIQRAELLDTPPQEHAFIEELRGVSIGEPPGDLPQPITVAVLARAGDQATGCPSTSTAVAR
jgi:hypothetical protein